jgi:hypothetical protein
MLTHKGIIKKKNITGGKMNFEAVIIVVAILSVMLSGAFLVAYLPFMIVDFVRGFIWLGKNDKWLHSLTMPELEKLRITGEEPLNNPGPNNQLPSGVWCCIGV